MEELPKLSEGRPRGRYHNNNGVGPTCDDITKEAVAEAGVGLRKPEEKEWLIELLGTREQVTENNYSQIMLPEGSKPIRNSRGTAPGCRFERTARLC